MSVANLLVVNENRIMNEYRGVTTEPKYIKIAVSWTWRWNDSPTRKPSCLHPLQKEIQELPENLKRILCLRRYYLCREASHIILQIPTYISDMLKLYCNDSNTMVSLDLFGNEHALSQTQEKNLDTMHRVSVAVVWERRLLCLYSEEYQFFSRLITIFYDGFWRLTTLLGSYPTIVWGYYNMILRYHIQLA